MHVFGGVQAKSDEELMIVQSRKKRELAMTGLSCESTETMASSIGKDVCVCVCVCVCTALSTLHAAGASSRRTPHKHAQVSRCKGVYPLSSQALRTADVFT